MIKDSANQDAEFSFGGLRVCNMREGGRRSWKSIRGH
nr:MAG TPA: hypothetical protein [Caudoviricetes sp.]